MASSYPKEFLETFGGKFLVLLLICKLDTDFDLVGIG